MGRILARAMGLAMAAGLMAHLSTMDALGVALARGDDRGVPTKSGGCRRVVSTIVGWVKPTEFKPCQTVGFTQPTRPRRPL